MLVADLAVQDLDEVQEWAPRSMVCIYDKPPIGRERKN